MSAELPWVCTISVQLSVENAACSSFANVMAQPATQPVQRIIPRSSRSGRNGGAAMMLEAQLEALVRRMVDGHILYGEAVREFKTTFIQTALRENMGNKSRTARVLKMHRNSLLRILTEMRIEGERRPPQRAAGRRKISRRIG